MLAPFSFLFASYGKFSARYGIGRVVKDNLVVLDLGLIFFALLKPDAILLKKALDSIKFRFKGLSALAFFLAFGPFWSIGFSLVEATAL